MTWLSFQEAAGMLAAMLLVLAGLLNAFPGTVSRYLSKAVQVKEEDQ